MPGETKIVEVLGANRAVEAATGGSLFQVVFGVMTPVNDQLRAVLPKTEGTLPPKEVGINTMILFFPFKEGLPYTVGSRWNLTVYGDGKLELTRA